MIKPKEQQQTSILHLHILIKHLVITITIGILLISVALFVGMCGYHYSEHMTWIDAFVNAAMILSGMGPISPLQTTAGKIFAGFYALFSGLIFIVIVGLIFSPILHRFFKQIHLEDK